MARIRTIKPEFPQSESMGRVSRDARLTFIQLWTLADDEGRLRGNSRMLASLLFPYDDDARDLIDGWLGELEREKCIVRYQIDGDSYIQICNWLNHQKVDKPSKSKIPPVAESSRILANPRERSSEDQGSRTKDQGRDQGQDTLCAREAEAVWQKVRAEYPRGIYRDSEWLAAEKHYHRLVEGGEPPDKLFEAVTLYRAQQLAKQSIGTQYVLSPAKFFGDKHWRGPFPMPMTKAETRLAGNLAVMQEFVEGSTQ